MADFEIPDKPEYSNVMRMLEPTDPGHADVFNPLFRQLLLNEEFLLKKMGTGLSSKTLGGETLSEEAVTEDAEAQFTVISKTQGPEGILLFEKEIPELFFGTYSVVVRLKCSENTGEEGILKCSASYADGGKETLLKEVVVTPEMFPKADSYHSLSFLVDYRGVKAEESRLKLTAVLLPSETQRTVCVDYVLVNYSYGAITVLG